MSRLTIYDLLAEKGFNPNKEYNRLCWFFKDDYNFEDPFGGYLTLYEYADEKLFNKLPIKGSHINLSDILDTLGINLDNQLATQDDVFNLAELVLCIKDADNPYNTNQYSKILNCIKTILDKTAHKIIETPKGRVIVPNNIKAEQASTLLLDSSPETALEILKYNHRSNIGNINNKKQVLLNLGNNLEPSLKLSKTTLSDNILFLLNNFDIRHNNRKGKDERDYIVKMNKQELEKWYDRTYNSIIAFIINEEQESINKEINQFKKDHIKTRKKQPN